MIFIITIIIVIVITLIKAPKLAGQLNANKLAESDTKATLRAAQDDLKHAVRKGLEKLAKSQAEFQRGQAGEKDQKQGTAALLAGYQASLQMRKATLKTLQQALEPQP